MLFLQKKIEKPIIIVGKFIAVKKEKKFKNEILENF